MEPPLGNGEVVNVLRFTNTVEELFIVFSRIEAEYNVHAGAQGHVLTA